MATSARMSPPAGDARPSEQRPPERRVAMRVLAVAVVLAGVATAILLLAGGRGEVVTIPPTADVTHVEVVLDAGAVRLVAGDELTARVERRAGRFARAPSGTAAVTAGILRITGTCSWLGLGRCDTAVTVTVPAGVAVSVRTQAGTIEGTVARGPVEAVTAAGAITLTVTEEVSHVTARTEAGAVELVVPDAVYAVDAQTTIGRTRVEVRTDDASDRFIRARAEVGHVTIRTAAGRDAGS